MMTGATLELILVDHENQAALELGKLLHNRLRHVGGARYIPQLQERMERGAEPRSRGFHRGEERVSKRCAAVFRLRNRQPDDWTIARSCPRCQERRLAESGWRDDEQKGKRQPLTDALEQARARDDVVRQAWRVHPGT